jgi:hypothetical protein
VRKGGEAGQRGFNWFFCLSKRYKKNAGVRALLVLQRQNTPLPYTLQTDADTRTMVAVAVGAAPL